MNILTLIFLIISSVSFLNSRKYLVKVEDNESKKRQSNRDYWLKPCSLRGTCRLKENPVDMDGGNCIAMPGYRCINGICPKCGCKRDKPDPEATCMEGYYCEDGFCPSCWRQVGWFWKKLVKICKN